MGQSYWGRGHYRVSDWFDSCVGLRWNGTHSVVDPSKHYVLRTSHTNSAILQRLERSSLPLPVRERKMLTPQYGQLRRYTLDTCSYPYTADRILQNQAYKTSWGLKVPGSERGRLLGKLADLMEKHQAELAALEALNVGTYIYVHLYRRCVTRLTGKHFRFAQNVDILASIAMIRYYAGWADKIHGKTIEVRTPFFWGTRNPERANSIFL